MLFQVKTIKPRALSLLTLVILVVTSAALFLDNRSKIDCAQLTKESAVVFQKMKYSQLYSQLKPHYDNCSALYTKTKGVKSDVNEKYVTPIAFSSMLAVSAYETGNEAEAKSYAKQGIKIRNLLTIGKEKQLDGQSKGELNRHLLNIYKIEAGIYRGQTR